MAGAKIVVVLGHSKCGAINGACDGVELGHLTAMLAKIKPAVAAVRQPVDPAERTSKNPEFVDAVARENVRRQVAAIPERSEVLQKLRDAGKIDIVGGLYDIATGEVEFLSAS